MNNGKFYYSGAFYLQTFEQLHHALFAQGLALLTGEKGVGKSALCRRLCSYLQRENHTVILLSKIPSSPEELSSILARELDLPVSANLPVLLPELLLSRSVGEFSAPVLLIDDAQMLSDVTLMELSRLSAARVDSLPAMRILLSGETELIKNLKADPAFKPFGDLCSPRRSEWQQLRAMSMKEFPDFVRAYSNHVSGIDSRLSDDSIQKVFKSSGGYPGDALRAIEALPPEYDEPEVKQGVHHVAAADDTDQATEWSGKVGITAARFTAELQNRVLLPVAVVVILASTVFVYLQITNQSDDDFVTVQSANSSINDNRNPNEPDNEQSEQVEQMEIVSPFVEEASRPLSQEVDVSSTEQLNREALLAAIEQARLAAAEQLSSDQTNSDSGLVLVTAAERGIDVQDFALPVYDSLADPQVERTALAPEQVAGQVAADEDRTIPEVSPEPAITETDAVIEQALEADQEVEQAETISTASTTAIVADDSEAQPTETIGTSRWETLVGSWVTAWRGQDLAGYFGFYHERFVPRYHSSRSTWRDNRERVIGNAAGIELAMYDFLLVSESDEEVEVHFWLDYRSPTYQDQTRKKLVLAPSAEDWLIVEEINLEVRTR
jgi:hypothetical protein